MTIAPEMLRAWQKYVKNNPWVAGLPPRFRDRYYFGFKAGWEAHAQTMATKQTSFGIPGEQLMDFERARQLYAVTYWANERLRKVLDELEMFESGLDAGIPVG